MTLTVQQEATSGTEDEGQDTTDVDGDEDEDMNTDVEEKDPETPEEREKFYQEVRMCITRNLTRLKTLSSHSWSRLVNSSARMPLQKERWTIPTSRSASKTR